jgi:mono/diheme cytochrome c family protein
MKRLGRWNMRRVVVMGVLLACGLIVGVAARVTARMPQSDDWPVPAAAKSVKNPVPSTPAALAAAKTIYAEKCDRCHGDTGKGDGADAALYDPPPGDLTDPKLMTAQTDGELYYKITQGNRPMPSYAKQLSDQQRWQMVDLLRTFVSKPHPAAVKSAHPAPAARAPRKH